MEADPADGKVFRIAPERTLGSYGYDGIRLDVPQAGSREWLTGVEEMEQRIDDMTAQYRRSQLVRMKEGSCDQEACIIYSELLTDFERIGDHVLNIAQELTKVQTGL